MFRDKKLGLVTTNMKTGDHIFLDLVVHFVVVVEKMIEKRRKSNIFVCAHPLCVSLTYLHLLSYPVNNVFQRGQCYFVLLPHFCEKKKNEQKMK